jgi:multimeric flavodoxin WrbA
MKLAIFNGSPRVKKSNSKILINHFLEGYQSVIQNHVTVCYLGEIKKREGHLEIFRDAEKVLIVFPLYTDSMPGIVKLFIEDLFHAGRNHGKKLGFIVQSGFPESIHTYHIERYLRKLTARLGCTYLGTVTKGGVEGIQVMPPFMTRNLFARFHRLGKLFAATGEFDEKLMSELRKPFRLSWFRRNIFRFFVFTGLTNFYWDSNLKKNNAYDRRFDKPYEKDH